MSDSRWAWVPVVGGVGTLLATWRVKRAKARKDEAAAHKLHSEAQSEDENRMGRIIDRLEHEIDRLGKEVSRLRAENVAQAKEMRELARVHRECDEKFNDLQRKVAEIESRG